MDILYSLFNVDNQRLDHIVHDEMFTKTLNFVLSITMNNALPIGETMLNRYCIDILPKINCNIRCFILESKTMESILLAADYPYLSELKIYNVDDSIVSKYFTVESPFRCLFQKQITTLTLVYRDKSDRFSEETQAEFVYEYTLKLFNKLKHLSMNNVPRSLKIKNISLNTCLSSSITKLCLNVYRFEDCFALLDGRFKHLTVLKVRLNYFDYDSSVAHQINDLPNMKSFSLTCHCPTCEFDTYVIPLLYRMSNLEELTLNITNGRRSSFVDGTELREKILVHMSRLSKFTFYFKTTMDNEHQVNALSEKDIQQSFINIGYEQVCCFFNNYDSCVTCQVFSLPFAFDFLHGIGDSFPSMIFTNVTTLQVYDEAPFTHEFFLRVSRCFPHIQRMSVFNYVSSSLLLSKSNELYSIVQFPHLISLRLTYSHWHYVEQFLNEERTYLPCLTKLEISYRYLRLITKNFTRKITRLNCLHIKRLVLDQIIVHSEDFYDYFPLLNST